VATQRSFLPQILKPPRSTSAQLLTLTDKARKPQLHEGKRGPRTRSGWAITGHHLIGTKLTAAYHCE
jgi:hypothetical protein